MSSKHDHANRSARVKHRPRRHRHWCWQDVFTFVKASLLPLCIILGFSFLKYLCHDSLPMDWLREEGFYLEHKWLKKDTSDQLPVVIVDISNLKAISPTERPKNSPLKHFLVGDEATPREDLSLLVSNLVQLHPAAIGIDIDFSPEFDENRDPPDGQPQFLDACARGFDTGVPIFLGVGRGADCSAKAWLGGDQYTNLAVCIYRFRGGNIRMPVEISTTNSTLPLRSMGRALADSYYVSPTQNWTILKWFVEDEERVKVGPRGVECKVLGAYVNYNFLESLEKQTIAAENILDPNQNPRVLYNNHDAINGRIVLIGDAKLGAGHDAAAIPGKDEPVPGVYTHACAACTLIRSPLAQMTPFWGVALAGFISIIFLWLKYVLAREDEGDSAAWKHFGKEIGWDVLALVAIFTVAAVLAFGFKVLWLDCISSALVFFLEAYLTLISKLRHSKKGR